MRKTIEASVVRIIRAASLVAMLESPTMAATYRVGTDPDCTHPTISDALFAAAFSTEPDTILLARNQSYIDEFIHLTNFGAGGSGDLTIAGGYATCASSTSVGHTEIDGQAGNSTFEIDTTGTNESTVTLRNLRIVGSGIRGVQVEGNTQVVIESSIVEANGGGINVEPGAQVDVDFFTTVMANRGGFGQGGGIRCWGGTVNLAGVLIDNQATDGGGLFAGNNCGVRLLGGALLVSNDANRGGGMFASTASIVTAPPTDLAIAVDFNTAADRGGGIYASNSLVTLLNASISDNQAVTTAGGIFSTTSARVALDRDFDCGGRTTRCSSLSRNAVTTGNQGAAAVANQARLTIRRTYIEGNTAPGLSGSVLQAVGGLAVLNLHSVAFWDNQGPTALILAEAEAAVDMAFVSATGNISSIGDPPRPIKLTDSATAELRTSIFWPNSPVLPGTGTLSVANCVIVSDPFGLPAGGLVSTVDPLFRDAAGGDLHLRPESPAVDYCDEVALTQVDIDFNFRPEDLDGNPNGSPGVPGGLYDIGFDEFTEDIFADGFE